MQLASPMTSWAVSSACILGLSSCVMTSSTRSLIRMDHSVPKVCAEVASSPCTFLPQRAHKCEDSIAMIKRKLSLTAEVLIYTKIFQGKTLHSSEVWCCLCNTRGKHATLHLRQVALGRQQAKGGHA